MCFPCSVTVWVSGTGEPLNEHRILIQLLGWSTSCAAST
jgi:hypothetical protein